jgi:hypothetical protein
MLMHDELTGSIRTTVLMDGVWQAKLVDELQDKAGWEVSALQFYCIDRCENTRWGLAGV